MFAATTTVLCYLSRVKRVLYPPAGLKLALRESCFTLSPGHVGACARMPEGFQTPGWTSLRDAALFCHFFVVVPRDRIFLGRRR